MSGRRVATLAGQVVAPPALSPTPISGGERFAGKCCLVTGAASGIGKAAAELFAAEGARLVLGDLNSEGLHEVVTELTARYGEETAVPIVMDVSKEADNQAAVDLCVQKFGAIDVLFANAGILPQWDTLDKTTQSSFEKVMKVNVVGPFLGIKHASAAMKGRGGSIVVTASIASIRADIAAIEYTASKAALLGLVRGSQEFLIRDGIRVNGVAPGGVMTPIIIEVAQSLGERGLMVEGWAGDRYPHSSPEEVAAVVAFLASEEAAAIKGQTIVVDKGMTNSMGMRIKQPKTPKES